MKDTLIYCDAPGEDRAWAVVDGTTLSFVASREQATHFDADRASSLAAQLDRKYGKPTNMYEAAYGICTHYGTETA